MGETITVVLFFVNLAAAAGAILLLGARRKLRASVPFHVGALVVGAGVYASMAIRGWVTERPEGYIPFAYGAQMFVAAVAWVPFLIFLIRTYVGALGAAVEDGETTTARRIEDARREFEFGHHGRAAKILREVLDAEPENSDAHALMAEIGLKRGAYEQALASYRLAAGGAREDHAAFARYVFKAAVILNEHLGDPKAAAKELDFIRQRMSGTPEAAKAHDWIVRLMDDAAREEA